MISANIQAQSYKPIIFEILQFGQTGCSLRHFEWKLWGGETTLLMYYCKSIDAEDLSWLFTIVLEQKLHD